VLYTLRDHLLLALVESKQEVRNKKNNHELNLEKMAKCTHPPRAAGPWSPCASALMPGFVLKRSCGGFVEFVPPQGRKMLALLAGLAEIAGGAGCSSL
jgi:hypothetical protein